MGIEAPLPLGNQALTLHGIDGSKEGIILSKGLTVGIEVRAVPGHRQRHGTVIQQAAEFLQMRFPLLRLRPKGFSYQLGDPSAGLEKVLAVLKTQPGAVGHRVPDDAEAAKGNHERHAHRNQNH